MSRTIRISNRQRVIPFPRKLSDETVGCANAALSRFGLENRCEMSISIVSPAAIRRLNCQFRGVDAVTDVLSFPVIDWIGREPGVLCQADALDIDPETGRVMLGDVIVCLKRAAQQAEEYGHSLSREVCFLAVHGVLHLVGYDHQNDREERRMQEIAESVLSQMGQNRSVTVVQTDQR